MIHEISFNGYRLDLKGVHRSDARLASNTDPIPEGYYQVGTGPGHSLLQSGYGNQRSCARPNASRMGPRQYPLSALNSTSFSAQSRFHLADVGLPASVTGVLAQASFFSSALALLNADTLDARVLRVRYSAPWMLTVFGELGQAEYAGKRANPKIIEYLGAAGFNTSDDSGAENAWCGGFASWIMKKHGYMPPDKPFRALNWRNFGDTISRPVYGAIGIKRRRRGGHVAFVAGKSSDGKSLYMIGGNQTDMVQVARYPSDGWEAFVVPSGYSVADESLPVYTKRSQIAGRED